MRTVLVIDDDKTLCELIKKCLEKENFIAKVSHTGLEGLRLLREMNDCTLVILDVMMPELDGFQVLKKSERRAMCLY